MEGAATLETRRNVTQAWRLRMMPQQRGTSRKAGWGAIAVTAGALAVAGCSAASGGLGAGTSPGASTSTGTGATAGSGGGGSVSAAEAVQQAAQQAGEGDLVRGRRERADHRDGQHHDLRHAAAADRGEPAGRGQLRVGHRAGTEGPGRHRGDRQRQRDLPQDGPADPAAGKPWIEIPASEPVQAVRGQLQPAAAERQQRPADAGPDAGQLDQRAEGGHGHHQRSADHRVHRHLPDHGRPGQAAGRPRGARSRPSSRRWA